MHLYEFKALSETEQYEAVWKSPCIGDRKEDCYNVLLYALGEIYVEVFYHTIRETIDRLESFRSLERLNPYLAQINPQSL